MQPDHYTTIQLADTGEGFRRIAQSCAPVADHRAPRSAFAGVFYHESNWFALYPARVLRLNMWRQVEVPAVSLRVPACCIDLGINELALGFAIVGRLGVRFTRISTIAVVDQGGERMNSTRWCCLDLGLKIDEQAARWVEERGTLRYADGAVSDLNVEDIVEAYPWCGSKFSVPWLVACDHVQADIVKNTLSKAKPGDDVCLFERQLDTDRPASLAVLRGPAVIAACGVPCGVYEVTRKLPKMNKEAQW